MKTTTSLALVAVLVASLSVFGLEACAPGLSCGPGTHSDGRQCQLEIDAGGAQAPVDEAAILRAGDQVHAESSNQGTDLTLAPFTRVCVDVVVLHADGTRTQLRQGVGAIEIGSSVPGIVTAANASECEVAGVVGLAPGTTTATVRLTANGLVVTAPLTVTVTAHSLEIYREQSPAEVTFGAPARGHARAFPGSPAPFGTEWLGFYWRLRDAAMQPEILPNDVWPAERFLSLTVADPPVALAQNAPGPGDRWSLTGLSPGQTTITLAFARPGAAAMRIDAPLHVTAFDPGGLTPSSLGVMFAAPDGTPFLGPVSDFQPALGLPRGCVVPTLLGFVTSGVNQTYAAILSEGVAWTTTTRGTATAVPGSGPTEICTEPNGIVTVRGCLLASGACGERELSVIDPTALNAASLAAHNQASQPIHGTVLDFGSRYQVCVPLSAELVLASTQFDVTFQTHWSFPMSSGPGWWWPSPTRSPVDDSICFDMNQYGYLGAGTTTIIATAYFGYPRPTTTIPVTLAGTLQHL